MVKKIYLLTIFAAIFVLLTTSFAHASNRIKVDKYSIYLHENLEVKIYSEGKSDKKTNILSKDFNVVSQSTSSQISIINGKVKKESHHSFYLKAKHTGRKMFSVQIDDEIQGPFFIEVKKNIDDPQTSAPLDFVEFVLKKNTIYVNEPTEVKVVSFTQKPVIKAVIKRETLSHKGLYLEPLKVEKKEEKKVIINKVSLYSKVVARYAIYPLYPGKHSITEAEVALIVGEKNFFGLQTSREDLSLPPLNITALPMPEKNKPKNFLNNYGDYQLSVQWEQPQVVLGNPATLEITVKGKGNLPILNFPSLNLPSAHQIGDVSIEKNYFFNGDNFEGTTKAKYYLLFYQQGKKNIPPIIFNSFEKKRGYLSQKITPPPLVIVPNLANKMAFALSPSKGGTPRPPLQLLDNEIRPPLAPLHFLEKNFLYCHKIAFLLALMGPLYAFWLSNKREKKRRAKKKALKKWSEIKKNFFLPSLDSKTKKIDKAMIFNLQKTLREFLLDHYSLDIKKEGMSAIEKYFNENKKISQKEKFFIQKIYETLKRYEYFLLANKKKKLVPLIELEYFPFLIKKKRKKLEEYSL